MCAGMVLQEEIALLLCSLLLGFGMNAWVAAGRLKGGLATAGRVADCVAGGAGPPGAAACWVLVYDDTAPDSSMLWEPCTGEWLM